MTTDNLQEWITFKGHKNKPKIVLISGDDEYRSEEALPQLAKILAVRHGFNATVLFAQDSTRPGILNPAYRNNIPGLEALQFADLMIIFTRFRALPDKQMQYIDDYLNSGKPVFGIRSSTHAFDFRNINFESRFAHYGNFYEDDVIWTGGFGRFILGEKWIAHHGEHRHQSTRGIPAPGAKRDPILNGLEDEEIWGSTDVYAVRVPLKGDSKTIVLGQAIKRVSDFNEDDLFFGMCITDNELASVAKDEKGENWRNPNDPMMPIAWTKSYQIPGGKKGRVFTTTIGASTDLLIGGTRRMLINAVFWCLDLDVPKKSDVDIVGNYEPSQYKFLDMEYWIERNIKISSLLYDRST